MPTSKRPRDPAQLAKLMADMTAGQGPSDKEDILNPPAPAGRRRSGHARAAALTPGQGREIARNGVAARWNP